MLKQSLEGSKAKQCPWHSGLMQMIDQGEQDDKIIGVHADDPEYRDYTDISQLPPHRLLEIRRWVGIELCG